MPIELETPVQQLPGIGTARSVRLEKLGIVRAADLLYWFPRDYEDRRQLWSIAEAPVGEKSCVVAMVAELPRTTWVRKGMDFTRLRAVDDTGSLVITFFHQSYVRSALEVGERYVFYGIVEGTLWRKTMTNPVFEREGAGRFTGCIMPIYPLTEGISQQLLSGSVRRVLPDCLEQLTDDLPETVRKRYKLAQIGYAIRCIHLPGSWEELEVARRRLVFEELFYFSAGLGLLRQRRSQGQGPTCRNGDLTGFYESLPFSLTGAQKRAAEEAARDLMGGKPMNRLLQGDVGSGKTVVGAACVWLMAQNGYQSAMMVPTEILADQHVNTLRALLGKSGIRIGLLTGSMRQAEKRNMYEALALGAVNFVVGTHALLSDPVTFANLGLVITDEQHRFGVHQRAVLARKGGQEVSPHVLVMSATPIPRTLALILYGDLDVSILDERPPGRQTVDTFLVSEDKRQRMYSFVRKQVQEGHQVYIVCPAVEEAEEPEETSAVPLKAATVYAQQLQRDVFPDLRVGVLHGKMKSREKERIMAAFSGGSIDVLVATTVIEVGVDVPNATLMIVENAERFGLSQLHQLRGRVGRGEAKSYCVLVSSHRNEATQRRLKALCETDDGFRIAEEDLKLRGPGDFFGARQHGLPQLRLANLVEDLEVLYQAREAVGGILAADSGLQKRENRGILKHIKNLFQENADSFN